MAQAPGSMTAAMAAAPVHPRESWLRIGVVRAGTIVEERWIRPGRSLTWGRSEHADVVVATAIQEQAELIRATERGWRIVGEGIAGRASRGGDTLDLAAGSGIDLDDGARARIEIGDAIVLVERRARPPERAGVTLPGSLRGALGIDQRFTAIALGSLCLHAAFLLIAGEIDGPYRSALEVLEAHEATVIYPDPEIPEITIDDRATPDVSDIVAEGDGPSPTADAPSPRARPTPTPTRSAPSASEIAAIRDGAIEDAQRLLIGGIGGVGGATDDLMRRGAPTMTEAELLGVVGGDARASGDPSSFGVGPRDGTAMTLEGLDRRVLAARPTAERDERHGTVGERPCCSGIVHPAPAAEVELGPGGDLPVDLLAREIARRRRRVQACYERALATEPELAGRLVLRMRVEPIGTLSRVRVEDGSIGSDPFHACVVRAFDGFRTSQPPEGGAVDVAFPFVFAPQR